MAVTDQQKLDFLLKKIGYTKTKTGSVVGTGAISGTPKQPFAEAIPSPLVVPNSSLWNEAGSIPVTAPGSDTPQVKVYLAASSGLRMTADSTSSGQRAYIAYSTYNNTSSTRLTNWIDTQFGSSYLIKVYKGDPNSGGVALSAAGSGSNDGWFFDYSAGVLNFNDTSVPSGVTDTNIYIVGYRYIGQTGAPTAGISTFSNLDLTVERNLDVGKQGGISTFRHNVQLLDNDRLQFGDTQDLQIYHFSATNNNFISGQNNADITVSAREVELMNQNHSSLYFKGTETGSIVYHNNTARVTTSSTGIDVNGNATFSGNVSIGGTLTYEDVKNVDAVGLITARSGIRVTGGVIEAQAGENKIPSLYSAMGNLPSAGSYHGMFAHVHATGRGYFAHAGNWLELVNREINGVVGTGTETYSIGNLVSTSSTTTSLNVSGVTTTVTLDVNGDLDVSGISTFSENVFITRSSGAGILNIQGGEGSNATINLKADDNDNNGDQWQIKSVASDNDFVIANNTSGSLVEKLAIATNGTVSITNKLQITGNSTEINFVDSNNDPDYRILVNGGKFRVQNTSNGNADVIEVLDTGNVNFDNGITVGLDLDVDGHTNLDNVSIVGVATLTSGNNQILLNTDNGNIEITRASGGPFIDFKNSAAEDYDVRIQSSGSGGRNLQIRASDGTGALLGYANNSYDLGSSSVNWRHLYVTSVNAGVVTATGADINGDIDVDGHTNLDNVSIAGVTTFSGKIGVHDGTTGSNGQYLRATGAGVTWANFPTMRTSQTTTASSGQTVFNFTYNVGFLDVFVNGVKLTSSEFTATNGSNVVLAVGSFVGDIVELVSYFTTSYAAGSSGLGEIVEDTTPQLGGDLDMFNKSITGTGNINLTGIVTATNFVGDGSGLTGITASGSGVVIKDSDTTVGTAGTINFGDNLSVSPASAGIVTITANVSSSSTAEVRANTLVVTGVSTLTNVDVDDFVDVGSNIQLGSTGIITATTFKGNGDFVDIDVDGHTNLDNVNVAGVTTFAGTVNTAAISASGALSVSDIRSNSLNLKNAAGSATYAVFSNGGSALLKHNNTDRLETSASGVTVTGTVAATSYTGDGSQLTGVGVQTSQFNVDKLDVSGISTFSGNIDVNADLDVDGHTNLDNVSIAGVTTHNEDVWFKGATSNRDAYWDKSDNSLEFNDNAKATFGTNSKTSLYHSGTQFFINNTQGNIYLRNNSKNSLIAIPNSSVWLYYNNILKFETASSGINVSGTTTTTGLAVTGVSTFTGAIDANGDLDVDGHTNLDNVSIAGVSTFSSLLRVRETNNTAYSATASPDAFSVGNINSSANTNFTGIHLFTDGNGRGVVNLNALNNSTNASADFTIQTRHNGTLGERFRIASNGNISVNNNLDVSGDLDVDGHTNLDNVSVAGVITATTFIGDGSGLTGITASGSGVVIKHDGSTVGTAGTINFGTNLDVSAISGGAVTITASGGSGSGISTISGVVNIANDLDVDGHTNLDNVSISGVTTITSGAPELHFTDTNADSDYSIVINGGQFRIRDETNSANRFAVNSDGHVDIVGRLDAIGGFHASANSLIEGNLELSSGFPKITFTDTNNDSDYEIANANGLFRIRDASNSVDRLTIAANGDVTINQDQRVQENLTVDGDLDVDGHTNLDNVSIAGVTTMSGDLTISNTAPSIYLTDTNHNSDFRILNQNGTFKIYDQTNGADRLEIFSGGTVAIDGNLDANAGLDVTGNATFANDVDVDGHTNLDNVSIAGVTTLTSSSIYPLVINGTNNGKLALQGSSNPYIYFREGTTDKGYIQWHSDGDFRFGNSESGEILKIKNGADGLTFTHDGTESKIFHAGNDGAGSSLDADLLDGQEGSYYSPNVGISTHAQGSFTASAGTPATINTYAYGSSDVVVEYTIYIQNGSNSQTQKLLATRLNTNVDSTQFAVMFTSSLLVQCDAVISSGNILLRATPETGVSGSTVYKVKREVM